MKNFLLRGILFSLAAYALFAVWIWVDHPVAPHMYFSSLQEKFRRLSSVEGRKIVLVGGSNVCFGFDSAKIERTFGIPVVNMGVHGEFGMMYQLRSVLPFVRAGDCVIFCPEYRQFVDDKMYGGRELFYVLNNLKRDQWKLLSPLQTVRNLGFLLLEEPKKAEDVWYYRRNPGYLFFWKFARRYNPNGFNEQGDEIWHWSDVRRYSILGGSEVSWHINPTALAELSSVKAEVEARGARLHILPPGLYRGEYDRFSDEIRSLAKRMVERGVPFELPPEAFRMDETEIYDTPYHLNLAGIERRTDDVIHWLYGVLPARPDQPTVFSTAGDLPTMRNVGRYLECSPGLTNRADSATAFIRTRESFGETPEHIRVRIPGLRSREYRLSLRFRSSRRIHRVLVCGSRLEYFPDKEEFSDGHEIALVVQLNETESFVDSAGDTVLGIKFPFWQLQPGDVVELTDIRFVPRGAADEAQKSMTKQGGKTK